MTTGMRDSNPGTFHSNDDTIRITPKKTNGTPIRSRIPTPTKSSHPGTATSTPSTAKRTPAKQDAPKASVTDMMIVGHWDIPDEANGILLDAEGVESEKNGGRAEFALFLRIVPLAGSTLEILHLNKNMHLRQGLYRAIPLLPDGSCPRESPGPTALGIPVVAGRYHRTADGKVKLHRRRPSASSSQEDLVNIDGAYESDGEMSNYSGDTVSSSIAAILSPDMFLEEWSNSVGDTGAFGGDSMVDVKAEANEADKWLESYNSGTRLTENASGHLCISFDDNVRRDPLVVEIYLEAEPIKLANSPPEDSSFVLAGLPFCKKGIRVSFQIESFSSDYEWVYDTKPVLSDVLEIGGNWFTGRYFTGKAIRDNTLVIRSHKIPRLQIPKDFTVDLITQVSPIPNPDASNFAIIYRVRIILNGTQPLEPNKRSSLNFKVYNVQEDDKWDLLPNGAELDKSNDGSLSLEIVRSAKETFQDIVLTIITLRNLNDLADIRLPRFIASGGIPLAETVQLEELGDQPIAYIGFEDLKSWRKIEVDENPNLWTRVYYSSGDPLDPFRFGLVVNHQGFPLPGQEIEEESRNDVVDIVSYILVPIIDAELAGSHSLFEVQMSIRYETSSLAHNERVFTIASGKWRNDRISFNGTYGDGIFQSCNEERSVWIILNNDYGRDGGPVLMESHWIGTGEEVYLTEDGEITSPEGLGRMDKYLCLEVPYVMDKWVHIECKVQRSNHGIESNWLDTSIPPRSSSFSPQRLETPASRLGTAGKERFHYSPSKVHDEFAASKTPGSSRGRTSGMASNHMRRGTLKGEIHRDEGVYVARSGARIFIYTPTMRALVTERNRSPKPATVKKVPGSPPELRDEHSEGQGQEEQEEESPNTDRLPIKTGLGVAEMSDIVQDISQTEPRRSHPGSPGAQSPKVRHSVANETAQSLEPGPTAVSILKTTPDENFNRGFYSSKPDAEYRKISRRLSKDKSKNSKIDTTKSTSAGKLGASEGLTTSRGSWSWGSLVWSLIKFCLLSTFFMIFSILLLEGYRLVVDTREEIYQVRNQMRRFQNMFEDVYGVNFGDVRWRRVRIHQDGDLVVLVRGDAIKEGTLSLDNIFSTKASGIDKDALWMEKKPEKKPESLYGATNEEPKTAKHDKKLFLFRKKSQAQKSEASNQANSGAGKANWAQEEWAVGEESFFDKELKAEDYVNELEEKERINDYGRTRDDSTTAVATLGHTKDARLYPWEQMREVFAYAFEKYEDIAGEAKEVMTDSWGRFLEAWKSLWYMT